MATSTISIIINAAISTAGGIFTTNLPVVISFAVGVMLFFVVWRIWKWAVNFDETHDQEPWRNHD